MWERLRRTSMATVTFVLTLCFFGAFFIGPMLSTLWQAVVVDGRPTFLYLTEVLWDRSYQEGLVNAFFLAIFSTIASVAIALPLAVLADRYRFPFKTLLTGLLLVPLVLPPFVGAIGLKQFLGQTGSLNVLLSWFGLVDMSNPVDWLGNYRFPGMVLLNALHLYPIVYLNVSAALANLDPAMEEAAENLGCSPRHRFSQITLPLVLPGLFAGCTISFIWSFTELGVPLIFDYSRITSVQIFHGIKELGGNPYPYALVTVVLIITMLIFFVSKRLIGNREMVSTGRASIGRQLTTLSTRKKWACSALFLFVVVTACLPHLGVVLVSVSDDWYATVLPESLTLEHYEEALGHKITLPSIANSLKYASLATVLNLMLGVAIAWVVVRTRVPGRHLLDSLAMLPLAVPGLVLAFGYLAMTREGMPFHFIISNPILGPENPALILIIAYAVRRLPFIVRSAIAGFQQTSRTLEEASLNLGASPLTTLRRITLPLIAANLVAGAILAFAFSMLEVSDSLILAQKQIHYPITTALYSLFQSLGNGPVIAAALGVWSMAFLTVAIIGASILLGRKMGALFRV